jgi:hypothetical protein
MRLAVGVVLVAADRHQVVALQQRADQGERICNRKRVPVEKHNEIVRIGDGRDLGREQVELAGVTTGSWHHAVEKVMPT